MRMFVIRLNFQISNSLVPKRLLFLMNLYELFFTVYALIKILYSIVVVRVWMFIILYICLAPIVTVSKRERNSVRGA